MADKYSISADSVTDLVAKLYNLIKKESPGTVGAEFGFNDGGKIVFKAGKKKAKKG